MPDTKARLTPIYFKSGAADDFRQQIQTLQQLLTDDATFLEPVKLGDPLPECEAVIFPQLLGDAFQQVELLRAIEKPRLIITSEFGTMSMWDWELIDYLRNEGVATIAPYQLEQTRLVCRALATRRSLCEATFLVFQDDPGEGAQAAIFKRFYWWETECTERLKQKFGVNVRQSSYRELAARAMAISDEQADAAGRSRQIASGSLPQLAIRSALKLYLALKEQVDATPNVSAVGINCLNESHFSDTTPCLAWDWLFEERHLIWGCEADTVAMVTKAILYGALRAPVMMTNLYPFLMGEAALKHERIDAFPQVSGNPDNHVLVAHCGYMGVIPRAFSTRWSLEPKVLAIVNDNAAVIDADLPIGQITLAKLHASMDRMTVSEGTLKGYAKFPGSDCLNGGIIEIADGPRLMRNLASHHYILLVGHHAEAIRWIGSIFGFEVDRI